MPDEVQWLDEPESVPRPVWHRAQPGPDYWRWRCLICGQRVDEHPSWWQRVKRRLSIRRWRNREAQDV